MKKIILTGIKPTGKPHIGNYIGAIKPALSLVNSNDITPIYFIADSHALTTINNPRLLTEYTYDVAATWLALGLDPEKVIFYKQSDIPEIFELSWILSCLTPKGLMNRAHAYKSKVQSNQGNGLDIDTGVNMGLYTYPILMAADILLFNTYKVPVGKDQIQHVEIARDIATYFNNTYSETFKIPEYKIEEESSLITGLDGRKMSKSYNNTIPLFSEEKELKKLIKKIKTDSLEPNEPKDLNNPLFTLYKEFANQNQINEMSVKFKEGISYGDIKNELFDLINNNLLEPRQKYNYLLKNPDLIDSILADGAIKARKICSEKLKTVKKNIGM